MQEYSEKYFNRLRLMVGWLIAIETVVFIGGYFRSTFAMAGCPLNLPWNNPPVETYNALTMGTLLVRLIGVVLYVIYYIGARILLDAPGDGDNKVHPEPASDEFESVPPVGEASPAKRAPAPAPAPEQAVEPSTE